MNEVVEQVIDQQVKVVSHDQIQNFISIISSYLQLNDEKVLKKLNSIQLEQIVHYLVRNFTTLRISTHQVSDFIITCISVNHSQNNNTSPLFSALKSFFYNQKQVLLSHMSLLMAIERRLTSKLEPLESICKVRTLIENKIVLKGLSLHVLCYNFIARQNSQREILINGQESMMLKMKLKTTTKSQMQVYHEKVKHCIFMLHAHLNGLQPIQVHGIKSEDIIQCLNTIQEVSENMSDHVFAIDDIVYEIAPRSQNTPDINEFEIKRINLFQYKAYSYYMKDDLQYSDILQHEKFIQSVNKLKEVNQIVSDSSNVNNQIFFPLAVDNTIVYQNVQIKSLFHYCSMFGHQINCEFPDINQFGSPFDRFALPNRVYFTPSLSNLFICLNQGPNKIWFKQCPVDLFFQQYSNCKIDRITAQITVFGAFDNKLSKIFQDKNQFDNYYIAKVIMCAQNLRMKNIAKILKEKFKKRLQTFQM
ncbi:Hypothetical_protein [Hexamita inflata]|uniref:Hypothetical_protein n=1 Tax=Hexamita inflata TaxID=28002 RepID=A0AA86TPB1_9EUKA|nr:Hypothetical protein HINF_LOCUS11070 [Hexamita inflata]